MGNTVQLKKNGQPVFPVTDVSLVMGLQDAIKLPPVKVTTLPTASAETAGKMYYVGPDANDEYERYITSATNGSYEWIDLGDTSIPLPSIADNLTTDDANTALSAKQGKVLNEKLGELEAKVDELDEQLNGGTAEYPYNTFDSYLDVALADIGGTVGVNIRFSFSGSATLTSSFTQRINGTNGTNQDIVSLGGGLYEVSWNSQANPNCDTMRFWLNGDRSQESHFVFFGASTSTGLVGQVAELEESVQDLREDMEEIKDISGDEISETLTWTNEKRVSLDQTTDSKIVNATSDYSISDYVEIPGTDYKLIATGLHGLESVAAPAINYYDATKKHIGYVYIDGSAELTIPTGVSYVLICQCDVTNYPTANVSLSFKKDSQFATKEDIDAVNDSVSALGDVKSILATNDDIDAISNSGFKIDGNGNLVTTSQITAGATAFMLFKDNIKAIEFTINASWGYGADFCFGYGYHEQDLCNTVILTRGEYKGNIMSKGADGPASDGLDATASAIGSYGRGLQPGRMFQKMVDVTIGDRCMMEIVCDKYICCYVWKNNKWEDWFMIFPTDLWSFCNIQNDGVRLRYGWNERFGLGVSVPNYNLAGGTTLLTNVRILSKTNSHLFDYHNSVTMRRGKMLKKNWLILGDSFCSINSDNGWGFIGYAERRTLYNAINLGVSGMYLANIWRQKDTIGWEEQVSALAMGDIVTIEGGGNDFMREGDVGVQITLENPNDKYDDTTTLGCLRRIIERIIVLNPYVSINVLPNQYFHFFADDTNMAGHTMDYFFGKICEVAKEYRLPYLEPSVCGGVNEFNIEALSYDNIHPNQIGSEMLGEMVAKELL